jgi:hypothetical protein
MHIAYYDEAGDDGFPNYSSPIFVLSTVCMHYSAWQENSKNLMVFRKALKSFCGLPICQEMHTRDFVLDKKPYDKFAIPDKTRMQVMDMFCQTIACLDIQILNVAINKKAIQLSPSVPSYDVLDRAFTYSIQRVENQLDSMGNSDHKFMIITDPGRIGKMTKTARKVQKFNFIPSKLGTGPLRQDIQRLIEDPIQKDSGQSYFIQVADLISFVVYQYVREKLAIGNFPKKMSPYVTQAKVIEWMNALKPKINTKASSRDPYGVVIYPH